MSDGDPRIEPDREEERPEQPAARPRPPAATPDEETAAGAGDVPPLPRPREEDAEPSTEPPTPLPRSPQPASGVAGEAGGEPPGRQGPAVTAPSPAPVAEPVAPPLPGPRTPWDESESRAAPPQATAPPEENRTAPAPPPDLPPLPSPPPPQPQPVASAPTAPAAPPTEPEEVRFEDLRATIEARRDEESERSYAELVDRVDGYLAQGYDLYGIAGYPSTGKTHAVKALIHRLQGFDPSARAELRRGRAPGPTEYWPFYYAYSGTQGSRWVLMDTSGDLYAQIHDNQWVEHFAAKGGLLTTIGRASGLLLLVHLTRGHLELAATGFSDEMDAAESRREEIAQRAQEELDFLDHFLLLARALHSQQGGVTELVRRAADASTLDDALRTFRDAPRLEVPVAVLFTQADRLGEGRDFAVGAGRYLAPQSLVGVAPFVARHLPTLFSSLLSHARRFRFDFVQSYVERPSPGGGLPVWSDGDEPLSVGLVPALEFLQRRRPAGSGRFGLGRLEIDTRTALRLHRRLHPRLWDGVEVDL